ncbi:MAG: hypothetical protein WD425_17605 [Nitrospirales bacterium]
MYLEQGEGPLGILIHGIPASNLLWRRGMPKLASTRNVYALNMLNDGKSDKPLDAKVSIEAQSRLIVKLIWSTEEGKKALFRNVRRLNPEYTLAIAGELKHLPHHTLIMGAEHEVFQKPTYALELQKTIFNAELIGIKKAGHWVMEDQPEEFA